MPAVRRAVQSKEVRALLVVIPLTEKYLSSFADFFSSTKKVPGPDPYRIRGAIAENERAFESFDVPKGTLRGSPPVPDDDLTTLRTSLYLVAQKQAGHRSGNPPHAGDHERAQGSSARAADFRADHRAKHRPGCLPSAAPWSGSRLQQHHAELHG